MSGTLQSLYHLVPQDAWSKAQKSRQPYYPPTYAEDGFIHLTADPALLLDVANHFYTSVPGIYLVLQLDPAKLSSKVVFEPAAPVGKTPAKDAGAEQPPMFPHLYGTIDYGSVIRELPVQRDPHGKFLQILFDG